MDPFVNPYNSAWKSFGAVDRQSGSGFLSIFSKVLPFVKSAVKGLFSVGKKVAKNKTVQKIASDLKNQAVDAGIGAVNDAVQGKNVKDGLKNNFKGATQQFSENLKEFGSNPSSTDKKRKRKKHNSKTETRIKRSGKKRKKDLFGYK